jgi:DNA replication protein DnaC
MTATHCTGCNQPFTAAHCTEFRQRWEVLTPPAYHAADPAEVLDSLRPVLAWRPDSRIGVGIHGPPGAGKTNTLALLALRLHTPFRWVTGARLRAVFTEAQKLDGEEQIIAKRKFHRFRVTPLLVIDDVLEVPFTPTWQEALFELLEFRNSNRLLTCWTAQHGEGQIAPRIGGEKTTAEAIERRLVQHHAVFAA